MQVPHKRWLAPAVAPPRVGFGAGLWRWQTPTDSIPALFLERALFLKVALWVTRTAPLQDGQEAVAPSKVPARHRCLCLGRAADQAAQGPEEAAGEEDELEGEGEVDSDEPPAPTGIIKVLRVLLPRSAGCVGMPLPSTGALPPCWDLDSGTEPTM